MLSTCHDVLHRFDVLASRYGCDEKRIDVWSGRLEVDLKTESGDIKLGAFDALDETKW